MHSEPLYILSSGESEGKQDRQIGLGMSEQRGPRPPFWPGHWTGSISQKTHAVSRQEVFDVAARGFWKYLWVWEGLKSQRALSKEFPICGAGVAKWLPSVGSKSRKNCKTQRKLLDGTRGKLYVSWCLLSKQKGKYLRGLNIKRWQLKIYATPPLPLPMVGKLCL